MRRKIETDLGALSIQKGISEEQIKSLVGFSKRDPTIVRFTGDKERFATVEKAKAWLKDGKTVYTLSDQQGELLGIIWFHPMDNPNAPEDKHTFAIRLYGESRGKGLAKKFMKIAFEDHRKKDVWLTVSHNNLAATSVYLQFGFKKVTEPDEHDKIVMVYRPS